MRLYLSEWCRWKRPGAGRLTPGFWTVLLVCCMATPASARTGVEGRIQSEMALSGVTHINRVPPTTRAPYDSLGLYSLVGDAPDAALAIARLAQPQLRDRLAMARVTLDPSRLGVVAPVTTDMVLSSGVGLMPHAELIARMASALQVPPSIPRQFLRFEGNGGNGVMTWLSERQALDINPSWLDFSMFDSMKMDVMNGPVGPGESEPQLWRSAFTVGMGAAWELQPGLALQAGYRFYENPMPTGQASGALLNATQHVIAASLGYRQGAHSLALTYGLDLMATAEGASISSARHGDSLASTAHLVSFVYTFAF